MSSALRFLLTLFTILCYTTFAGAAVQVAHAGVDFGQTCVLDGGRTFRLILLPQRLYNALRF